MQKTTISIIGLGSLGKVLAGGLSEAGFSIRSVYNRSEEEATLLAQELDADHWGSFPKTKTELGSITFIAVPDRSIEYTAKQLAAISDDFMGQSFVHCSGNESSECLASLQQKGADVASFHPLQTFTSASDASDFEGIYFDLEGDVDVISQLKTLSEKLGAHHIVVSPQAKPYLHAAAVMASNYLVALVETAGTIAEEGGMDKDEILPALMPLIEKSVNNISQSSGFEDALSGPVARGDIVTVNEHLKLLDNNPQLSMIYRQLGKTAVALAERKQSITPEQKDELNKLFNDE